MKKLLNSRKRDDGFTLVEVSVAMFTGIIVFGFAISFLVSFSSASYQAKAKSQVTAPARNAMTRTLKDVANAANTPACAQWNKNTISVGTPVDISNAKNCVELYNTQNVIVKAQDYAVCWNLSKVSSGTTNTITFPEKIGCLFARESTGTSQPICKAASQTQWDTLYYSECNNDSAKGFIAGSDRLIADLGPHQHIGLPSEQAMAPPQEARLFTYVNYDASKFLTSPPYDYSKILKITVRISIAYENGKYDPVTTKKDYSTYIFLQTIQLNGMKAFLETGAYGS